MDPSRSQRAQMPQASLPYATDSFGRSGIQFSDPWSSAVNPTSAPYVGLTSTTMAPQADPLSKSYRQSSVSQPLEQLSLGDLNSARNLSSQSIYPTDTSSYMPATTYATSYADTPATSASPIGGGAASYALGGYQGYAQDTNRNMYSIHTVSPDRRLSHPNIAPSSSFMDLPVDPSRQRQSSLIDYTSRASLNGNSYVSADAMEASRGMMNLSQNRYSLPHSHRNSSSASSSSYYPSSSLGSVSGASSISSAGSYGGYGFGSIGDGSGTDLSSLASAEYDVGRPSLPRPSGMIHSQAFPSGPGSMMTTFNSRVQTNTQKKHKCKVCDKRFTRPSSLQTHMYSHTGEKPFVCEVAECGRAFSVVSNLRRHRKVHKGLSDTDTISNAGSV